MKKLWILILLAVMVGGTVLTDQYFDHHQDSERVNNTDAIHNNQELNDSQPNTDKDDKGEAANPELTSILSILGESKELSDKQKTAMDLWRNDVAEVARKNPKVVFINGPGNEKKVALTFDDGPDGINTPKILDILKENQVPGNFFFKGQRISEYADIVRRTAYEGNLVLSHTFSHWELDRHTPAEIDQEISLTENAIKDVTGNTPAIFRPPFGAMNETVIKEAEANNDIIVLWSIDTLDWSQKESENIAQNVLRNVRSGDIILMHSDEDKQATVEALPIIISGLKTRGYSIVGLDELLNVKAYKQIISMPDLQIK